MSKAIVNTFKKLDTDTSQNKQDNSSFYDAQDLRLISDEPLSNGALVNYKGTKAKVQVGSRNVLVKGYAEVGNNLVLLLYNETTTDSMIAKVNVIEDNTLQLINGFNYILDFYLTPGTYDLLILYNDSESVNKLGFGTVDKIETVGRYENIYSRKIYFAVPNYPLRVFNIQSTDETVYYDANMLDILPNNIGNSVTLSDNPIIQGGKLETGKIQYACKLFNKYGAETTFSPCSELISLTSDNYNGSNEFKGSDLEDNSGKSVKINITLPNLDFGYIHIYSIHYKVKDTPVISLVGETKVLSTSFSFIDNGTVLDTLTLEEFNIFGGKLLSAETIGTKNNILFAANTIEVSDTIELDARAYRYSEAFVIAENTNVSLTSWTDTEISIHIDDATPINASTRNLGWLKLSIPKTSDTIGYYKIKSISTDGLDIVVINEGFTQSGSTVSIEYDIVRYSLLYGADDSYYVLLDDGRWVLKDSSDVALEWGEDSEIPVEFDCINKYNDEFLKTSGDVDHPYPYFRNISTRYGGSGKIVSYEIKTEDTQTKLVDNGVTIVNSSNINYILKSTSFKQGETYRFGLTAYDLKGKPYFTNWIGDIRIPYFTGTDDIFKSSAYYDISGNFTNIDVLAKNVYIEFSINTANIDPLILAKISGFQIVKVQRTTGDKSVLAQGSSLGGVVLDDTNNKAFALRSFPVAHTLTDTHVSALIDYIHTFYSPEFNINGGINAGTKLRLYIVKILVSPKVRQVTSTGFSTYFETAYVATPSDATNFASSILYTPSNWIGPTGTETSRIFDSLSGSPSTAIGVSFDIVDALKTSITEVDGGKLTLMANSTGANFINRVISDANIGQTMYGPTGIILSSNTLLPVKASPGGGIGSGYTYVLDLYIDNASIRYGGNTYLARTLNEYESCSLFISKEDVANGLIAYGDSYNTIWDTITSGADPTVNDGGSTDSIEGADVERRQVVSILPLESSINCMLTGSKPSKYILTYPSGRSTSSDYIGLAETQVKGISIWGSKYPNVGDFNSYNTVYSSTSKYPTFFSKPNLFDESTQEPNSIYASEKKSNGEYVDSWSKFLYANSLEVEGIYGAIHKLTTLDNKLFFFQESAIGVAAVNDRYIIGAGDAAKLALGTGDVLERFDYVKYNEGVIKPEHVINTISNLYFIDHNRRVIDIVGTSDVALSIDKGVNSMFRKLYKDRNSLVALGFDPANREVLFTIGNMVNNIFIGKTLVYNENINQFGPRSSATPSIFINIANGLLSFIQSNNITGISNYVYKHNAGELGELYSEAKSVDVTLDLENNPTYFITGDIVYSDSFVSILVGTSSTAVFVADNVEFRTEVRDYNEDNSIFSDLATYAPILNSTLKTGAIGDALKTVDSIEFKNSYQSVLRNTIVKQDYKDNTPGVVPNTSRRHRSWTTQVPLFKDVTTGNNTRFVDTFLSMKFTFKNENNKVFKLHDIITYIRPTHK